MRKLLNILLILAVLPSANLLAQSKPDTTAPVRTMAPISFVKESKDNKGKVRILFIFDNSQSMLARWQTDTRINIAKRLITNLVDSLKKTSDVEIALRVFGHQFRYPPPICTDTRLEVPFGPNNHEFIKKFISTMEPKGTTPIAKSLEAAGGDFPKEPGRNIVILITDGIEECDGDPCAVSLELQRKNVILRPFIIGMGVDPKALKNTYDCVGTYFDAADEKMFKNILDLVVSQAINKTSAQVNLIDLYGNPVETNVNMTFYELGKYKTRYNYVHTMNAYGVPDTLLIDPMFNYRIVVNTIPPVVKDSIKLIPGIHNTIGIKTPQGQLSIQFEENSDYKNLQVLVRKSGEQEILHVQQVGELEKYLVGCYDLEVLCLPRLKIPNVEVKQSHTAAVTVPKPGLANFIQNGNGYGSIYLEKETGLTWISDFNDTKMQQTFLLLPGNYRVVFRSKTARQSVYTFEKSFQIDSGKSMHMNLY